MPTLRIRFPGGRYHATPWGHHVNEGQIEWPPSPWRILRALVACGFTTQRWSEIPPVAGTLIEKLAATLPSYRLPQASAAHSRHFMPIGLLDKGREKTTLVFDTWADVGNELLEIQWNCNVTGHEATQLAQLADRLGYLGRSESWIEAEMVTDVAPQTDRWDAFPCLGGPPGQEWEQVSLMAPIPAHEYAAWRHDATQKILAEFSLPQGKKKPTAKLMRDQAKAIAPYPEGLLDCLTKDTAWWKQHRWSQPPGTRRVIYWRRTDSLEVSRPRRSTRPVVRPVTTMLLALTTPSGNKSALPPCSRTLPQAELFHRALVGRVARGGRVQCPELTGRDEHGQPLRDGHCHAHLLPVDLDDDGHLDHIIIHAKMRLGEAAQRAIRTLRRTWTKGSASTLQLALAGCGDFDMLRKLPAPLNRGIERVLGPTQRARIWESVTPFVPPRFLKRRGANTLLGQINAELASRDLRPAEHIEPMPSDGPARLMRHYVRRRTHGGAPPPVDIGYSIRLTLTEPIHGPLTLGYASHFGLGMFAAVIE